mgnify:CR=1 FL=1
MLTKAWTNWGRNAVIIIRGDCRCKNKKRRRVLPIFIHDMKLSILPGNILFATGYLTRKLHAINFYAYPRNLQRHMQTNTGNARKVSKLIDCNIYWSMRTGVSLQIVPFQDQGRTLHRLQTLWCWRSSVQDSWLPLVPMSRWYFWLTAHRCRDETLCWTLQQTYKSLLSKFWGLWRYLPWVGCSRFHELKKSPMVVDMTTTTKYLTFHHSFAPNFTSASQLQSRAVYSSASDNYLS